MTHYLEGKDEEVQKIIRACFPAYNGKQIKISTDIPSRLDSYWDGGSRDYFVFYNLTDGKVFPLGSNHPFFEAGKPRDLSTLPAGVLIVKHSIFCGKDHGITIYCNAENLTPFLPAPTTDLTRNQHIVLTATCGLKSFARYDEAQSYTGISKTDYAQAQADLIALGYLNKASAVTPKGRNARKYTGLYQLRAA